MHELPVSPDGETDGRWATEPTRPTTAVTPLRALGAPMVGDLEPAAPAAAPAAEPGEPGELGDGTVATEPSTEMLRRAALLRLVGLGRSRIIR